ncbi:unnamed protein product [Arabis nemorensis]|uniref:Uncharacterized protein n=1 Tax=Arabis nemorensis TaxID=586526 RepID=A0A565BMA0_9BRAS|nr:unnamed protein product [Arabis nemorensis]
MFAGTRQLDKIMSYGRTKGVHRGLEYTGINGLEAKDIKFVSAGVYSHPVSRTEGIAVGELELLQHGELDVTFVEGMDT